MDALHRRWAAEEAMMRRAVPEFSLQKELADPEMRRLMQLPGMRMLDAYRPVSYTHLPLPRKAYLEHEPAGAESGQGHCAGQ